MKLLIILPVLFMASCINQRKVTNYLDDHVEFAADQCAKRFPVKEITTITVKEDTGSYESFIRQIMQYADSISQVAEERNTAKEEALRQLDAIIRSKEFTDGQADELMKKLASMKRVDVPALRRSIEAEIRRNLKPCKDSVIVTKQESTATIDKQKFQIDRLQEVKTAYLQLKEDKKDLSKVTGWLLLALVKKWWFWLILAATGTWIFIRIRAAAYNGFMFW